MSLHFLVDEKGNKTCVVLDIKEYEELLERAEDADALRLLDYRGKCVSASSSISCH